MTEDQATYTAEPDEPAAAPPDDQAAAPTDDQQAREAREAWAALQAIQDRADPRPTQPAAVPYYNHPNRWYARSDGHIVELQGSPQAERYYTEKGYHPLSPAEVRDWERRIKPIVRAEQRKRADLITHLRDLERTYPRECRLNEARDGDLGEQSTEFLESMLATMTKKLPEGTMVMALQTGYVSPSMKAAAREDRLDRQRRDADLSGVEMGGGESLRSKIAAAKARGPSGRFVAAGE